MAQKIGLITGASRGLGGESVKPLPRSPARMLRPGRIDVPRQLVDLDSEKGRRHY